MNLRTIFALLLAPLLPCALAALGMATVTSQWSQAWRNFILMFMIAEPICFFIAGPAYLIVRRFRPVGSLECAISGLVFGALLGPLGMFVGIASGYVFWAIALRQQNFAQQHS